MIDIHTHILPFVDDGSDSLEKSISLIKSLYASGVTDVVCTPHLRANYRATAKEVLDAFTLTKTAIEKENIPVKLHLGRELYVSKHYKDNIVKFDATMLGSKYVLVEFDFGFMCEVTETVYELVTAGYIPIVAHPERYDYMTFDDALEVKNLGGLLQLNADSILSSPLSRRKRFAIKLFKNDLVDFVASDVHFGRENRLQRAKAYVSAKFGKDVASKVFNDNAKKIIEG